jgi:translation elongation factor EF-1alpha
MAYLVIKDVFNITGHGIVLVGLVQGGPILPGMQATYKEYIIQIRKMEQNHQALMAARVGDSVGVNVVKISGPEAPAPKGFQLFPPKDKYFDVMKTLKGVSLEFA